jgi:hypothetical protein
MDTFTLADVLTIAGATISAGIITGLIAMGKRIVGIGPRIDDGNEPTIAFVLSAILVIAAFAVQATYTAPAVFAAFLAWYAIAQIAMGIHDTTATVAAKVGNA